MVEFEKVIFSINFNNISKDVLEVLNFRKYKSYKLSEDKQSTVLRREGFEKTLVA